VATVKVSVTLDGDLVDAAKARVGERGFSRYINEALALRLQHERLEALEDDLAATFGPIPDEARARIETARWPR
jgi:hypothetical protein